MHANRLTSVAIALAASAILAACGSDDDKSKSGKTAGDDSGSSASSRQLRRPILAPCAAPKFAKPHIVELKKNYAWSLQYSPAKKPAPSALGAGTTVLIVEYPTTAPPPKNSKSAKRTDIAGRSVVYNPPRKGSPAFTAYWKTKRAFYALVATGNDEAAAKRFIGCLP